MLFALKNGVLYKSLQQRVFLNMEWIKVSPLVDTTVEFIKPVSVKGRKLVIISARGRLYAVQAKCPHAGADLSRGWCKEGSRIVCPYHRYEYDLCTGKGKEGQGDYIETYTVEMREDGIYIGMKKSGGWLETLFGS